MTYKLTALYKCRLCGEEFSIDADVNSSEIAVQISSLFDKPTNGHNCKDGKMGCADFLGVTGLGKKEDN